MGSLLANFAYHGLLRLVRRRSLARPLGAFVYLTYRCNLACAYCDDGTGRKYPDKRGDRELATDQWIDLLRLLRRETDLVIFTGGEPYLRADLAEILRAAKELRFGTVCVLTNGLDLDRRLDTLDYLDVLNISLDTLDAQRADRCMTLAGAHERVLRNIALAAERRRTRRFALSVAPCITVDSVADARAVLAYALERDLGFVPQPANVATRAAQGLVDDPEYQALVDRLIALKRRGAPIMGSLAYLKAIKVFPRFACQPTLLARIRPDGELVYPCTKRDRGAGSLLALGGYRPAVEQGARRHGSAFDCQESCPDGCYLDFSLLVAQPMALLREARAQLALRRRAAR